MTTWDDELEPLEDPAAPPPAEPPPRRRRRRPRAGRTIAAMGARARAKGKEPKLDAVAEKRQRAAEAQRLLDGGRNKGEERGFGLSKGPAAP